MKRYTITIVLLAAGLVGCVRTQATMLTNKTYSPVEPDSVAIYLSEEDIPGEYEKIAIINAQGEASYTNENQMYNAARKRAAKIGANGILIEQVNEPGSGAKVAAAVFGTGTTRRGQMVAIRVMTDGEQ